MEIFNKYNKKGQFAGMGLLITIFAIVGLVASVFFIANLGKDSSALTVTVPGGTSNDGVTGGLTFTEDVTVTFSSFDMFSKGTSAGVAHRILELDGTTSTIVSDDSTLEKSPGNSFIVLLGNVTDAATITAGTTYYPRLVSGVLPDDGTFTVGTAKGSLTDANYGGQAKTAGLSDITFTFTNEDGTANAAQALGANDADTKVKWKIIANDNVCVGNPDAERQSGKQNLANYLYNTTEYNSVIQLDAGNNDQTAVSTPTTIAVRTGHITRSYTFPTVCDNNELTVVVRLATGSVAPTPSSGINITVSDISWYVDDDTLEAIAAYEDEDNNDIGVTDFVMGNILVS